MHCLQYYCTRNHVQTWISIICSCTIVQYYCKLCYYLFTSLFLCLSFWSSLLIEFYKTTYNTIFFLLSFKIELLDTTLFWAAFVVKNIFSMSNSTSTRRINRIKLDGINFLQYFFFVKSVVIFLILSLCRFIHSFEKYRINYTTC